MNNLVKKKGDSDEKLRSLTVVSSEMAKCRHPVVRGRGRVWFLIFARGFGHSVELVPHVQQLVSWVCLGFWERSQGKAFRKAQT